MPKVELESNQVLFVLDRGFLYFAKFIIGIVVLILGFATAYFGFDIYRAREAVHDSQKEIEATKKEVEEAKQNVQTVKQSMSEANKNVLEVRDEAVKLLDEAKRRSAETQAKLDELLGSATREVTLIHAQFQVSLAGSQPSTGQVAGQPAAKHPGPFTVPELASYYNFPSDQDGTGQTIALIELGGGYRDADLAAYFSGRHLRRPNVVAVPVGNGGNRPGDPNGPDAQVTLDIEVAGSVAPGARLVVYFAPNTYVGFLDAITTAIHDTVNKPSIISISWGGPESTWTQQSTTAFNRVFEEARNAGITVVVAAGDNGATDGLTDGRVHVDFPAASPWVLAVGGTSIQGEGNGAPSEQVWNSRTGRSATGGGVSEIFARPEWQANVAVPPRKDGTLGRGVPDVAALADPLSGYQVLIAGKETVVGGTAAATPLWAGLIALLNQGLGHNVGFLNKRLYEEIGPAGVLRSITSGDNGIGKVAGYSAGPGWNAAAGWGTPDGQRLLEWLRHHP